VRKAIAWTVATPLGICRGQSLPGSIRAGSSRPPISDPRRRLAGLRPTRFYATSTDMMAVTETLPGYMARYKSLNIPMAMLYGKGDRLLDYRARARR
jgi:hypothetical protein